MSNGNFIQELKQSQQPAMHLMDKANYVLSAMQELGNLLPDDCSAPVRHLHQYIENDFEQLHRGLIYLISDKLTDDLNLDEKVQEESCKEAP